MPELDFRVTGVEAVAHGLTPLLHFKLQVTCRPATETVQGLLLHAQIQIQPAQRSYNRQEKERLVELFGTPERWGQTVRNRLWTHTEATLSAFTGEAETVLPVPCTYDLNVLGTKYLYALEAGEAPLLFLFSGSIFYTGPDGRLQVQRISWNQECAYRMPASVWREMMEGHYPGSAWLSLPQDVFERLYAYRRRYGLGTWEETVGRLLGGAEEKSELLAEGQHPKSEIRETIERVTGLEKVPGRPHPRSPSPSDGEGARGRGASGRGGLTPVPPLHPMERGPGEGDARSSEGVGV